jgi:hypothetical protein
MEMKRILVVGDSHSKFWTGHDNLHSTTSVFTGVDCLHIGPATAYSLANPNSSTQAASLITSFFDTNKERYGCVVFSFGEIDCRVHIVKNALAGNKSLVETVNDVVNRYFYFVKAFSDKYNVYCLIWGPIPSSPPTKFSFNPEFPAVGSIFERNYVTYIFNETISNIVKDHERIGHFSIFDKLVDADYVTKSEYLYDGCHLSNLALGMAEAELRKVLHNLGILNQLAPTLSRAWPIVDSPRLRNVAAGAPYVASTIWHGYAPKPFNAEPDGELKFHTDLEDQPNITLILDAAYFIKQVKVHNRIDACQERARWLAISVSGNGTEFEAIFCPDRPVDFADGDNCLIVDVNRNAPVRFVKLYLREKNYFHLQCVEVLVASFQSTHLK